MKYRVWVVIIRFLFTFRKKGMRNATFDLSNTEIPYNEIAKIHAIMDISESEKERRLKEARELFTDVTEFFESEAKQKYLTTVISKSNIEQILIEIEQCFIEAEDFEKCTQIGKWREQL